MLESWKGRRPVLVLLGLFAGAVLLDALAIEPWRLVPRDIRIPCPGIVAHPVRVLLFSDVDFLGTRRRERAIRDAALKFAPDLVLVAGDFFERSWETKDAALLESGVEYLASLPAPSGRFLAPGEEESPAVHRLREAWGDRTIEVLSNESRSIEVRGERLDLFVANPPTDPAPWACGREGRRSFVGSRGRFRNQFLVYTGAGAMEWGDVEITFAFQALDRHSQIDFRFAWRPGPDPVGGTGWSLVRHQYSPEFRLRRYGATERHQTGRWGSGFIPPVGVWCRARIQLTEHGDRARVRARLWKEAEKEPERWSIDAEDADPSRGRQGTVAFAGRAGGRRYADLRVALPGGAVLLEESFADPSRLRSVWQFPSALADWVFHRTNGGAAATNGATLSGFATSAPSEPAARLILAHDPDIVLDLADLAGPPPSLVLAGHTHGGQVRLPWLGTLYIPTRLGRRYDKGLFAFRGLPLFITSGVGTSLLPVRLFNPPEVVLLTLTPMPE